MVAVAILSRTDAVGMTLHGLQPQSIFLVDNLESLVIAVEAGAQVAVHGVGHRTEIATGVDAHIQILTGVFHRKLGGTGQVQIACLTQNSVLADIGVTADEYALGGGGHIDAASVGS